LSGHNDHLNDILAHFFPKHQQNRLRAAQCRVSAREPQTTFSGSWGSLADFQSPVVILGHEHFDIIVRIGNTADAKGLDKHLGNIRGEETRQRRSEVNIFHTKV
jgi:hypothetical protein